MEAERLGPPGSASSAGAVQKHLCVAAAAYTGFLIHFSLNPCAGWRTPSPAAWDYWIGPSILPVPRFYPLDATLNVLAYIPLGALALCIQPRTWRFFAWAGVAAWLTCTGLSLSLKVTQAFLPSRISSKVDLVCNSVGAALGVVLVLGADCLPRRLRATCGLAVNGLVDSVDWAATLTLGLWLFCLLSPQRVPFMMGPWIGDIAAFCFGWGVVDGRDSLVASSESSRIVVQGVGSLTGLAGALLLALSQIHPSSRRLRTFCPLLLVFSLGGWLLPQIQEIAIGRPWLSPLKLWGGVGLASAAAATVLAVCVARSDWPCRRVAQMSFVALCITVCCTTVLPGVDHLGTQAQAPPQQRIVTSLVTAAVSLNAVWSVLGLLTAWRLSTKSF